MASTPSVPIQPVDNPIICGPYDEPNDHWVYGADGAASHAGMRRPASYWYKTQRTGSAQQSLPGMAQEQSDDLPLVNQLREDVRRWRAADYRGASNITKELLNWWSSTKRDRRLFFCQREAVETIIYLAEIRFPGRTSKLRFKPELSDENLTRLLKGERPQGLSDGREWRVQRCWIPSRRNGSVGRTAPLVMDFGTGFRGLLRSRPCPIPTNRRGRNASGLLDIVDLGQATGERWENYTRRRRCG